MRSALSRAVASLSPLLLASASLSPPRPNARQLEFMELELSQFMHFGVNTFWDPNPTDFLYTDNPTYHNCYTTNIDKSNNTGKHWPCLSPHLFNPTDFDTDNWMAASKAMGVREICLTAAHEGGFALWPSNFTRYSVKASNWRGGKGDVLREFADAANRHGIKICYYLQVSDDGWGMHFGDMQGRKYTAETFLHSTIGRLKEVLTNYGPVNRFWFDGAGFLPNYPPELNDTVLWQSVFQTIHEMSPATLISPKRGDICQSNGGRYSLYVNDRPEPNSTDTSFCTFPNASGTVFTYLESHGVTIQEGPDGNTDALPTFWFWHPWACAQNISGCPWVGHSSPSRLFANYLGTVGHGTALTVNIPPDRSGKMNASVVETMADFGAAVRETFGRSVGKVESITSACADVHLHTTIHANGASLPPFDYITTMEGLADGQRIANYSVEYLPVGATEWKELVKAGGDNPYTPGAHAGAHGGAGAGAGGGAGGFASGFAGSGSRSRTTGARTGGGVGDPIAGHFERDQHVGHKRIDVPSAAPAAPGASAASSGASGTSDVGAGAGAGAGVGASAWGRVAAVRLRCIRAYAEPVVVSQGEELSISKRWMNSIISRLEDANFKFAYTYALILILRECGLSACIGSVCRGRRRNGRSASHHPTIDRDSNLSEQFLFLAMGTSG